MRPGGACLQGPSHDPGFPRACTSAVGSPVLQHGCTRRLPDPGRAARVWEAFAIRARKCPVNETRSSDDRLTGVGGARWLSRCTKLRARARCRCGRRGRFTPRGAGPKSPSGRTRQPCRPHAREGPRRGKGAGVLEGCGVGTPFRACYSAICAWTAVMATTPTMSSAEQPRDRSLMGAFRPWRMGP